MPMWDADAQRELAKAHPMQRMIEPEEIVNGVLFTVQNRAVRSEVVTIDGDVGLKHFNKYTLYEGSAFVVANV